MLDGAVTVSCSAVNPKTSSVTFWVPGETVGSWRSVGVNLKENTTQGGSPSRGATRRRTVVDVPLSSWIGPGVVAKMKPPTMTITLVESDVDPVVPFIATL